MSAAELLKQAKLGQAIDEVSVALRQDPTDKQARTFLFELLCFTGDLDRANKHLELVAHDSKESKTGGLLYHAALQAERTRQDAFEGKLEGGPSLDTDKPAQAKVKGTFNGAPFEAIGDSDPRIGGQLEVIAGLDYLWVPSSTSSRSTWSPRGDCVISIGLRPGSRRTEVPRPDARRGAATGPRAAILYAS
ncbi:MAG: hypothetical protein R2748_06540 [Bryobacterales bacterium]